MQVHISVSDRQIYNFFATFQNFDNFLCAGSVKNYYIMLSEHIKALALQSNKSQFI